MLALPTPGQPAPSLFLRQTVSAEEIAAAGLTRMGDLIAYLDGVRWTTVHGYAARPAFGALALPTQGSWQVFVDGQPYEVALWGVPQLALLPISLQNVARVTVYDLPRLHQGHWAGGGVLHFVSKSQPEGAALASHLVVKNETGDPGPLIYTPNGTGLRNVDKVGPDGSALAGYRAGAWSVAGGGHSQQHIPTDDRTWRRNWTSFRGGETAEILLYNLYAQARYGARATQHTLRAQYAWQRDMLFSRATARETPLQLRYLRLGAHGHHRRWRYYLTLTSKDVVPYNERDQFVPVDWRERAGEAVLQRQWESRLFHGTVGGGAARQVLEDGLSGKPLRAGAGRLFASAAASIPDWQGQGSAEVAFGASQVVLRGQVQVLRQRGRHRAGVHLSHWQGLPHEYDPLAMWQSDGATLARQTGSGVRTEAVLNLGSLRSAARSSAEARWRYQRGTGWVRLHGGLHWFHRWLFIASNLEYLPGQEAFSVAAQTGPYAAGLVGHWGGTAAVRLGGVRLRLHYDYQRAAGGEAAFRTAWQAVARHRAQLVGWTQPVSGLWLHSRLGYQSGTTWAAYERLAGATNRRYVGRVPGFWRWDIHVRKQVGKGLGFIGLGLENLLNDRIQLHPAGAQFDLAFKVQLSLILPTAAVTE